MRRSRYLFFGHYLDPLKAICSVFAADVCGEIGLVMSHTSTSVGILS